MISLCCAWQGMRRHGTEDSDPIDWIIKPGSGAEPGHMTSPGLSEMFAYHATTMANTIKTSLLVFSRKVGNPGASRAPQCVTMPAVRLLWLESCR